MTNLLYKASIVTTPTAYGVGVLNSIKPAQSFGEELVTNGNFATDSDWNKGTGWSILNGKATHTGLTGNLTQNIGVLGKKVLLTFEVLTIDDGVCNVIDADISTIALASFSTIGVKTVTLNFVGNSIGLRSNSANCSIDNVSVKEMIDADFDFTRNSSATRVNPDYLIETVSINSANLVQNGNFSELGSQLITNGDFATDSDWNKTQATISNGVANISSDGSYAAIDQSNVSVIGKTYLYSIDVKSITGTMQFRLGSGTDVDITTIGIKTGYIVATSTTLEIKRKSGAGEINATIDNVSVKQVDPNDNWTITNDYSFGENKVIYSDVSSNSVLYQSGLDLKSGHKYKLKFTVELLTANQASIWIGDSAGSVNYTGTNYVFYPTGSQTVTFTMPSNQTSLALYARTTGGAFSIDNISLIEIQQTDIPRLDYTNGTASILLENQSTNLIANSNFQSGWSLLSGGTITLNQAISPEGIQNAALLTGNGSASNAPYISVPVTSGTSYAFSLFVKSILSTSLRIIGFSVEAGGSAKFDLSSGVVSIAADDDLSNAKIENYGNGWYRCSVIATADGTGNALFGFESDLDINGNNFYIYGAQFEQSSFPTSIINTSGSIQTRAAETLNNAGNSDLINSTEGVLYAEISALSDDLTNRTIALSDGTTSNTVRIQYLTVSNSIWATITNIGAGGNQAILQYTSSDITINSKVALKYKANDFSLFVNGIKVATDSSGVTFTSNTLNTFQFDRGNGAESFYGRCKTVAVFSEALSDTELACLTSTSNREIFLNYYYRMQYVGANTEALSCAEQTFNI